MDTNKFLGEVWDNHLGKLPPQAVDLEEAVLGAIMIENHAINKVLEVIKDPEIFYKESHAEIFRAALHLLNENEPIDLLTVTSQLRKTGKLELCGGAYRLTEITQNVNSSANIETHCRIVLQQAIKRYMIKIGSQLQTEAYEDITDPLELISKANELLNNLNDTIDRKKTKSFSLVIDESMDLILKAMEAKNHITGVPSGFVDIDRITHGWQKSDLIIIAARPSMGKSAFVICAGTNAAIKSKIPVAIFSLEMSNVQVVQRIQASQSDTWLEKLRTGNLSQAEAERVAHVSTSIKSSPLHLDDTSGLKLIELRAKVNNLVRRYGIQMIIIDYLQLMVDRGQNRAEEVGKISRGLKAIAKEFNIPVIALSQLNRGVEARGGDFKPRLSDLKESGDIEQDADLVMFLHRPEYYKIYEAEDGTSTKGICIHDIAKHRNGRLGEIETMFNQNTQAFADREVGYMDTLPDPESKDLGDYETVNKTKNNG